jgi:hypothetical protein
MYAFGSNFRFRSLGLFEKRTAFFKTPQARDSFSSSLAAFQVSGVADT